MTLLPCLALAQEADTVDVWKPLRSLIGEWEGTGSGPSGTSTATSYFKFVLGDQYIEVGNRAIFEPQEANPDGEIHEDRGFISFDAGRQKFVLRQFHVEGFVNQYVLDTVAGEGTRLVFVSESLENAPPSMRAKWTIEKTGADAYRSFFDLAMPGKEFVCFGQSELKRQK
jgi:hypothetical protein